jgi:glycosyltransferase involved in cell wall biosynthesis
MKIAYDHQIFGWQRYGGVSRYFFELASHIKTTGDDSIDCRIICPFHVNEYLQQGRPSVHVTGIHAPAVRRTGRLYRIINEFLAPFILWRWRPNVLHETYYAKSTVSPRGCKTVLTVFDMIHELYPEFFPTWDRTSEEKRTAVARADHIVCISENTRQDLIRLLNVPAEKTTVVHLGFALSHSKVADLAKPHRPFILFVGARGGYKNFDRLLQAYAGRSILRESYDLVAFGGGDFSSKERTLLRSLGLNENQVRQIGGDDSVLGALYQQASLFVYPSLYEGFGIPPLEAMSLDCPVACSNTSSMPEVVGNATVQFDPHDVDSIANALEAIITNPALQADLRQRGRERLHAFSWQRCALETLNVYRKLFS